MKVEDGQAPTTNKCARTPKKLTCKFTAFAAQCDPVASFNVGRMHRRLCYGNEVCFS